MITGGNRDDLGSSAALILRFKLWRSLSPYRTEGGHHKISILSLSMQVATAAKSLQSCPTLCNPIDGSPAGSPIPGILQARTLEWVAISFSNAWKWKVKVKSLSRVRLFATPWFAAYQAPPSMGFARQEYWSGLLLPSPSVVIEVWNKLDFNGINPILPI